MISVTPAIQIDERELEFNFIRSPGPGGQNVNKVATAVQLKFNVAQSPSIPAEVKERLAHLAGRRMTAEGILIIEARQYRSQERNRQASIDRLVHLIQSASQPPKTRRKSRPSHASVLRRLETKRKRGEIKRIRRNRDIVE